MAPSIHHDSAAYAVRQEASVALFEFRGSILDAIADLDTKARLLAHLAAAEQRADVDVILFCNRPGAFAEAEVRRFHEHVFAAASGMRAWERDLILSREENAISQLAEALEGCRKVTVAGLCGRVVGPFFGLSLAFDFRLAAPGTVLSAAPVDGVPPGGGLGFYLPHYVGLGAARQILILGEDLSLPRAQGLGLVYAVVGDGEGPAPFLVECRQLAAAMAGGAEMRYLLRPGDTGALTAYFERESRLMMRAWHQAAAGMAAVPGAPVGAAA